MQTIYYIINYVFGNGKLSRENKKASRVVEIVLVLLEIYPSYC